MIFSSLHLCSVYQKKNIYISQIEPNVISLILVTYLKWLTASSEIQDSRFVLLGSHHAGVNAHS